MVQLQAKHLEAKAEGSVHPEAGKDRPGQQREIWCQMEMKEKKEKEEDEGGGEEQEEDEEQEKKEEGQGSSRKK